MLQTMCLNAWKDESLAGRAAKARPERGVGKPDPSAEHIGLCLAGVLSFAELADLVLFYSRFWSLARSCPARLIVV